MAAANPFAALLAPLGQPAAPSRAAAARPAPAAVGEPVGVAARTARALELTRELLDAHGFLSVRVEISTRAKRRAGACKYRGRRPVLIQLSAWLVEGAPWAEVDNTIRHEVAHAIAGFEAGHGPEWKRAARLVGAKPVRCYGAELKAHRPPMKYSGTCQCPGKLFERSRLSDAIRTAGRCPTCRATIAWRTNQ